MKRLLAYLLCASLLLVACGKSQNTDNTSQSIRSQVTSSSSEAKNTTAQISSERSENTTEVDHTVATSTTATYNGLYYSVQGKYGDVIIVNKKHPVAMNYAPGEDLTALEAFQVLVSDMQTQGFSVSNSYSGFRSYETQAGLYNNYVARDGQAEADRYSARPGYSEHQTGLAFDLLDGNGQLLTETTATAWLAQNAHYYGFIVRYLPGKESSTGYMAESWHIRYIGLEATDIYQSGLTLEEYFGLPGGGY
ncbi:LD-carboxypeptidase LdcB/DacB [Streptococcus plurextorum]|uniref:LD-carboxypeptidase LdcB/DacB n=1 Tax=Streptococcus plurextorum TaxID=456876 RepID=UPI00040CBA89|nr:LD-carboxypeptidase LdcB/DacB [Streptococcus plurextorum]